MAKNIHVKFEYPEAIAVKKEILLLEKDLLEATVHLKNYEMLKKKEYLLKSGAKKDFAALNTLVMSVEAELPEDESDFEVEKYEKQMEVKEVRKKSEKRVVERKRSEIETELDSIKEKLAALDASEL